MPTAVSVANFETAIGNCYDAILAGRFTGSTGAAVYYAAASAMNAGLLLEVSDEGSMVKRRDSLKSLKDAIDAAKEAVADGESDSRFIRTRTSFGGG
jgi:hypothetical protein